MDFQKPLNELEERVSKVKTSVRTATAETDEQLNEHVAKVQENTERELDEAKQHASAAAELAILDALYLRARANEKATLVEASA